jgi:hypothetical protein
MWYYSLVEECIMNLEWIKKNGEYWAAGRVECYDSEDRAPWSSHEWGLIIHGKDWRAFDDYLRKNPSDELLSLDKLIENSKLEIVKFKHDEATN